MARLSTGGDSMRLRSFVPICGLAVVAAAMPAAAGDFQVSFRWCSGSSEIALQNVPKGTVALDAEMTDLWVPSYPHGGGKVAWKGGKTIPCAAISDFRGPAPPAGQVHDYQWTVKALAADGGVLATAKAVRRFPE
jgi:hypothetical protein